LQRLKELASVCPNFPRAREAYQASKARRLDGLLEPRANTWSINGLIEAISSFKGEEDIHTPAAAQLQGSSEQPEGHTDRENIALPGDALLAKQLADCSNSDTCWNALGGTRLSDEY